MSSITIVATYFGAAPLWMPAFLLSCRHNPDVRWLLYTDMEVAFAAPPNVELRALSIEQFNDRCRAALGLPIAVSPDYPRKLGDLKPAYGLVFADDLRAADFWAYSELDIVWGDIRRFLTPAILQAHDIVSGRHYKLAGHFTLFRNDARLNRAFLELIPDAARALVSRDYCDLDEKAFTTQLRERAARGEGGLPRVFWEGERTIDAAHQNAMAADAALWWRNGRTYDEHGDELMYLHFHRLKPHMRTIDFGYEDRPVEFRITRGGIFR